MLRNIVPLLCSKIFFPGYSQGISVPSCEILGIFFFFFSLIVASGSLAKYSSNCAGSVGFNFGVYYAGLLT